MTGYYRTSAQASAARRRKMMAGLTLGLVSGRSTRGVAECAAWAGDGSCRIQMMESVQAIPAFDTVRIWVQ